MKLTPAKITTKFVDALNQKFKGKETQMGPIEFHVLPGKDYDKITLPKWDGTPDGSAHAFVERTTGKLYRAASWKYPVADARFDLSDEEEFARAIELADPVGNYLRRNYTRKSYENPNPNPSKTPPSIYKTISSYKC
jgi:hypothetical protein